MIGYINEDLLVQDGYICHQCNTISNYAKGLALEIFKKFPKANVYGGGIERFPGEIIIVDNVINMIAQIFPGRAYKGENRKDRIEFFRSCLYKISKHFEGQEVKISFPFNIGCGLAGGKWEIYRELLEKFALENQNLSVFVCKL